MKCDKKSLRKIYKEKRKSLYESGAICVISDEISKKLNNIFETAKKAQNIMLFYPIGSELNVLNIINAPENKNRNFYLPVCKGEKIAPCPYKTGDELILNKYKILEPKTEALQDISILDIVITPAICADKSFQRLGYGGGYYDRFFADKNLTAQKIVIIPDEMLVENIPCDEFDIKCDMVVTEKRTLKRV